ncbi:MAG: N-methyl-L-tryptophan oxidase [Nitriliruptorales bacterium]
MPPALEATRIGTDVIVIGLGGMGSAVACELARRGRSVLGLDRFAPPHTSGSSHGRSRVIRQAYFEHPGYVPLVLRAYERWRTLEHDSGRELLRVTGGLMIGNPDSEVVAGALGSAREHGLAHDVLSPSEVERRWPAFRLASEEVAVHEPEAGVLFPEDCVEAHLTLAAKAGAELRTDEAVTRIAPEPRAGVRVETATTTQHAERVVLTAGAWASELLGGRLPLEVERQYVVWFATARDAADLPVFVSDRPGDVVAYGIPDLRGDGMKAAFHHGGFVGDPDELPQEVSPAEIERLHDWLRGRLPGLEAEPDGASACLYTNTPDGHFAIGPHPDLDDVVVAAGFSGHGFKFASVVGEVAADLAEGRTPGYDIGLFDPGRFPAAATTDDT